MQNWYVRVRGRTIGPFGLPQLREMRNRGQLQAFHEVSTDQITWRAAGNVDDVFPQIAGIQCGSVRLASSMAAPATRQAPAKHVSLALVVIVGGALSLITILSVTVVVLLVVPGKRGLSPESNGSRAIAVLPELDPARPRPPPAVDRPEGTQPARANDQDTQGGLPSEDKPRGTESYKPAASGQPPAADKSGEVEQSRPSDPSDPERPAAGAKSGGSAVSKPLDPDMPSRSPLGDESEATKSSNPRGQAVPSEPPKVDKSDGNKPARSAKQLYAPKPDDFRLAYDRDLTNQKRQAWNVYFDWVKRFYVAWTNSAVQVLQGVEPEQSRDELRACLNDLGRLIATEWAKDNATRKIDTRDLGAFGSRINQAKARDSGSGEVIRAELAAIRADAEAKLGR